MSHQAFALGVVLAERARAGERFHEFLRVPALSAGLYVLPVGGSDPQSPVCFAPAETSGGGRC